MNKRHIIGIVLLVAGVVGYFLKPFEAGPFEFLSGFSAAIGVSLILGWFKKTN